MGTESNVLPVQLSGEAWSVSRAGLVAMVALAVLGLTVKLSFPEARESGPGIFRPAESDSELV